MTSPEISNIAQTIPLHQTKWPPELKIDNISLNTAPPEPAAQFQN